MKYGAALVVMAIGEQGRAVTAKDKADQLPLELYIWIQFGGKIWNPEMGRNLETVWDLYSLQNT